MTKIALTGPLRYLIGADGYPANIDRGVYVVPYDVNKVRGNQAVGYCNLFDEEDSGDFGPYLKPDDVSEAYDEPRPNPKGKGFKANMRAQFSRRRRNGFKYVEIDNVDSYGWRPEVRAIFDMALNEYGLHVLAKNPNLLDESEADDYLRHPSIAGIIVERDSDVTPKQLALLRKNAERDDLYVWFVAFGSSGQTWANKMAYQIKSLGYPRMGVTLSTRGEYKSVLDLFVPKTN